ncbi:S28 family serine protease [Microbulbifer spongiae]|uniref:Aminopeptidase n=1 Tax=Microbulbifer spongiae TaxID=2944933 RepID=A0ABY9EA36_9GAMM|nr:S28 family serine protease [Microbulbifer sp. MI-G]WKD48751.1 hypothetical protein M8T91_12625 [Microbulbifer sp. MI-G]
MKTWSKIVGTIVLMSEVSLSHGADTTVLEKFESIRGIKSASEDPCGQYVTYEAQCFTLMLEQPVDHLHPLGKQFEQRIRIIHRSFDAPMALRTRGYALYADSSPFKYFPIEPTALIEGNFIDVEHRYFGTSKPADPLDWSKLTIKQAANDIHTIVERLKELYSGQWISFGYSKGGMTSTYYRNFYPNDVQATVALAAPLMFGRGDARHDIFLSEVGTEECRSKIIDFQRDILSRRIEMLSALDNYIDGKYTANRWPGGTNQALEHVVGEYNFIFWQFSNPSTGCETIPAVGVSAEDAIAHLDAKVGFESYMDEGLSSNEPYYWQLLTQLGYPSLLLNPLSGLLEYNPEDYLVYAPAGVNVPNHDWWPMSMMDIWARFQAERVMYVYADFDPFSAAAYPLPMDAEEKEVYRFDVFQGHHNLSRISFLSEEDRLIATNILREWVGLEPTELEITVRPRLSVNETALPVLPLER